MTAIGIYLFFVSSLSGYHSSKYWPSGVKAVAWLGKPWLSWGAAILGLILLLTENGYTTGALLSFCAYMTISCGVVFFVNCSRLIRLLVLILFHTICMAGLILYF